MALPTPASMSAPRLGWIEDELFWKHRAPAEHPERPERLDAVLAALSEASCEVRQLAARDATPEELRRVHTAKHLERLAACAGNEGFLDPDTYFCEWSYAAALRAAGACARGVDALIDGECDYFFAAVRPPGHHACSDRAMGFCLINNVAVAAGQVLHRLDARCNVAATLGVRSLNRDPRVLIFDWDVHHGNGTEEIFYESAHVCYISTHQYPFYPGTGAAADRGRGAGQNYTLNVPMRSGSGDAEFEVALREQIVPVIEAFDPDVLLVSAGFDAHARDPLATLRLSDAGYAMMTEHLLGAMPDRGRGRVGFVLEGGYDLIGLTGGLGATLSRLCADGA